MRCSLRAVSIWLLTLSFKSCWFYKLMCVCVCVCVWGVSVFHDGADSLHWTWADSVRLDSLSVEHPSPVSLPSNYHPLCPALLLCLSILISVLPSVSRSIFHFRFNLFDVLSLLLLLPTPLPPFLSSSAGLSICRPRPLPLSLSWNQYASPRGGNLSVIIRQSATCAFMWTYACLSVGFFRPNRRHKSCLGGNFSLQDAQNLKKKMMIPCFNPKLHTYKKKHDYENMSTCWTVLGSQ